MNPLARTNGQDARQRREVAAVVLGLAGMALSFLGHVDGAFAWGSLAGWSVPITIAGLLFLGAAVAVAHPLNALTTMQWANPDVTREERRRRTTRVKVLSLLLSLLILIAAVALTLASLYRVGVLAINVSALDIGRGINLLCALLALGIAGAYFASLQSALERRDAPTRTPLTILALLGAGLFLVTGAAAGARSSAAPGLRSTDAPFFLLAALAALALALHVSRSLPTLYGLVMRSRDATGAVYLSRRKSVAMPAAIAFALFFMILLLFLVFQLGVSGLLAELPRNTGILGVFLLTLLGFVVTAALSLRLFQSGDRAVLYRRVRDPEQVRALVILVVSGSVAFILLVIAGMLYTGAGAGGLPFSRSRWIDFVAFSGLVAMGPYGFYAAARHRRIRRLEERFPDFLRDLAASRRAGLTLEASIQIAAKGEYGALTAEIQKMADQLSWNVPFNEALSRFGARVHTPLVQRAVSLIIEASRSGGHVNDVLIAAATDAREIKNLENDRRTNMALYSIIVYVTFLTFLFVVGILYKTFIPEAIKSFQATQGSGATGFGGLSFSGLTKQNYRSFYFVASLVQSVGNGFIGGLMESGKLAAGLRHAFAMVAITYVAFTAIFT